MDKKEKKILLKVIDVMDLIEEEYEGATPASFGSISDAVKVACSALRYLEDQCFDADEVYKDEGDKDA